MKVRTIILLAATMAYCVVYVAGVEEDDRIVGGYATTILKHKYLVQLCYYRSWICGGTLVSRRHVVTASHCVEDTTPPELSIRAGTSYVSKFGKVRQVVRIWMHPKYNPRTFANDIAVLKLSKSLSGGRIAVAPLCSSKLMSGDQVVIAGWGALRENGATPDRVRAVNLPLLSGVSCEKAYPGEITTSMICASKRGKDSCQGDSGGPLVKNGQLCGVVSWGYGCARPNYPGVYTSVPEMMSFIKSRLKL